MLNQGSLNGMMTATAADGMLRPHNAAASRWLHFVATTQRRRKPQTALCGDHTTPPQPLTALCGDHMTPPQALTALCGDHMTPPNCLGRYAQNYKKIETKNFQKKEFLQFSKLIFL